MARARSLKPDFFTDADLTELSPLHRLLFAGLWCHADREGRLEDKPREIKVKVLPFDDCNVDAMLTDLARKGRIVRYEVAGRRFIAIPKFPKHQHVHKDEKQSVLPAPPEVMPKPPEPFEAGVAAMVAPQEHRSSTEVAPHKPGASTPLICNRVSVSGSPSSVIGRPEPGAPSAPPLASSAAHRAERPGELADRLKAEFLRQRGANYRWDMRDEHALEGLAKETAEEISRRWAIALKRKGFPTCATVKALVEHWNHYSAEEGQAAPATPKKRAANGF